jgi:hypothetical protein
MSSYHQSKLISAVFSIIILMGNWLIIPCGMNNLVLFFDFRTERFKNDQQLGQQRQGAYQSDQHCQSRQ